MEPISKKPSKPKDPLYKKARAIFPFQVPLYVGPISVWVFLFVLAPLAIILYYSFLKTDPSGRISYTFTLDAYKNVLAAGYGRILILSLGYAFMNTLLCILVGYPAAYYIARYGGRWKIFMIFLIVIPSWTSYLIRLYAFKTIAARSGLINSFLMKFHIISAYQPVLK